jgi:hypothetical protein
MAYRSTARRNAMHRWIRTPVRCLPVALLITACCPKAHPHATQSLSSIKTDLRNLDRAQRAHHDGARRTLPRVVGMERSCDRLTRRLDRCKTCCPCKDLLTPLAVQRTRIRSELAANRVFYAEKHPRIQALEKSIEVAGKYIGKLQTAGHKIDQCKLSTTLVYDAYHVEHKHAQISGTYGARHPKLRALAAKLAVLRQAATTARAQCKPTK